jgi:hypothetical protein
MAPAANASEAGDAARLVCLPYSIDGVAKDEAIRRGNLTASTGAKAEPYVYGQSGYTEVGLQDKDRTCDIKIIIRAGATVADDMAPSRVRAEMLGLLRARGFKPVREPLAADPFDYRDAFCSPEGGPQYIALLSATNDGESPISAVFLTLAGSPNRDSLC